MDNKFSINIDSGSLSIPTSPIFQKERDTYLCPFCITKLEKLEPKCPECQHKIDWSRFADKNTAYYDDPFREASVL